MEQQANPPTQPAANAPHHKPLFAYFRNWLSLAGAVLMASSFFAFILLFAMDTMARTSNPYVGVLTYLVAPIFTTIGLVITLAGMFLASHNILKVHGRPVSFVIDLARQRDRRILGGFIVSSLFFLLVTAVGSYHSYHFTESVTFCGETCHTVMQPEAVLYRHSPHARVTCAECHIGPGAEWFVKAKISGLHQVYAVAADTYPRPVPTPIQNLRPARDTCEQCHWPAKFTGDIVRTYRRFLSDRTNTEYAVRMLMHVGGSNPGSTHPEGIHWHTSPANKVEYIATDKLRNVIPWVRLTQPGGKVVEFRAPGFTNAPGQYEVRTMDCLDCHNRPSHRYSPPNEAVDTAIAANHIDRALPFVRSNSTWVLVQKYASATEATNRIAAHFASAYPGQAAAAEAAKAVQGIYGENFFPAMNASWKAYPENIGHKNWPGCFRCHDDKHVSSDKQRAIRFTDCTICHTIVSQGSEASLAKIGPAGQPFQHPADEYDTAFLCNDCHTGGP